MKHIIRLSLKEIINKKILTVGILLTVAYLLVYGIGIYYLTGEHSFEGVQWIYMQEFGFQFMSLGWYVSTFIAGALAVILGAGSISAELENGTMLGLASSPLSRRSIVLGKYTAYSIITGIYCAVLVLAVTLIAVYFFRLMIEPLAVLKGVLLFMIFPLVLLSVTYLVSTLTSTLTAGISVFMLFSIGIIGGFIEQMGVMADSASLSNIGIISSLIMPADAVYRMAVSLASQGYMGQGLLLDLSPFGASATPSPLMLVYTIIYIAVFILLAVKYFQKMDL